MRFPSKANLLAFLRAVDFPVGTILDVGAHAETVGLRLAYPDRKHVLFEPAAEFHPSLARNYADVDHVMVPLALSDSDGEGLLRKYAIGGGDISHAGLLPHDDGGHAETVDVRRIDTVLSTMSLSKPYLLKIDVDGFELPILRGAAGILHDVSCIIMEATTESFLERANALSNAGFRLFDIIDQCYYRGVMAQVDLVFLAARYMTHREFRPWDSGSFKWADWNPIDRFEGVANNLVASEDAERAQKPA